MSEWNTKHWTFERLRRTWIQRDREIRSTGRQWQGNRLDEECEKEKADLREVSVIIYMFFFVFFYNFL